MKNIKQVSLNSIVFYVEEDGYIVLKQYIDNLERYYADKENGKEIVEDIQIRFAELLSEKRTFPEQAITLQNIEDVINVLGYPDNFEPEINRESKQHESPPNKKRKQLYRDMENAKIGGVCSGLAYYLGTEAWVFRLIFIILGLFSAGFWILVYFILWFVIPQASTAQQRYEMKGEALNIEDIEQKIKSGIHDAEAKIKDFANKNKGNFRETASEISSGAATIFKIIGKILGVGFIFTSVCAIVAVLLVWLVPIPSFFKVEPEYSIFCVREVFSFFGLNGIASYLCLLCFILPFVGFFLLGISLLINKMKKALGVIMLCVFLIWIASSIFFGIGMVTFAMDKVITDDAFIEKEVNFPSDYQTIVVKSNSGKLSSFKQIQFFNKWLYVETKTSQNQLYGITELNTYKIFRTNDSIVTVRIYKANCKEKIIREFQSNIVTKDSILYIPYLFPLRKDYWSGEKIYIELSVPKGKQLIIEEPFTWRKRFYTEDDTFGCW